MAPEPVVIPQVDSSWTLFLDRDGVLNRKINNGYVLKPSMLEILPGVPQAMSGLAKRFGKIVVVTNQRGIARGLMTYGDLEQVHSRLLVAVGEAGGRIEAIFVCPHDVHEGCECRKPGVGLALKAKVQFAQIDFAKCVLVGDSASDMQMGKALGMHTARIRRGSDGEPDEPVFSSLLEFSRWLA